MNTLPVGSQRKCCTTGLCQVVGLQLHGIGTDWKLRHRLVCSCWCFLRESTPLRTWLPLHTLLACSTQPQSRGSLTRFTRSTHFSCAESTRTVRDTCPLYSDHRRRFSMGTGARPINWLVTVRMVGLLATQNRIPQLVRSTGLLHRVALVGTDVSEKHRLHHQGDKNR
jgi:hypothetical protein